MVRLAGRRCPDEGEPAHLLAFAANLSAEQPRQRAHHIADRATAHRWHRRQHVADLPWALQPRLDRNLPWPRGAAERTNADVRDAGDAATIAQLASRTNRERVGPAQFTDDERRPTLDSSTASDRSDRDMVRFSASRLTSLADVPRNPSFETVDRWLCELSCRVRSVPGRPGGPTNTA
jgi:hypothetical protein